MTQKLTFAALAILVCLVAGCDSNGGPGGTGTKAIAGLTTFESCEALADFLESKAGSQQVPTDTTGTADGAGTGGEAVPTADFAPTVEEADIVKQEGARLYVVTAFQKLFAYDVSNPSHPQRVGEVSLTIYPQEMYVLGTKVAVIGQPPIATIDTGTPYEPMTSVAVYEMANPASPALLRMFDFKGSYGDSRKIGGAVYLALQRWISEGGPVPLRDQLEDNAPCDQVYVPEEIDGDFASFLTWNIVGLNLNALGSDPNEISVVGSWGSTVYSTPEHFYLTNYFWETGKTGIYLFDLEPSTAEATPRSSSSVPGSIVNQFSMDETDGVFRIVSTSRPTWIWAQVDVAALEPSPPLPTETINYLTTFRADDGSLTELAQIDTIVPGESITAARFLGDEAFVTTFVVTDPLVSIDLSDPENPGIKGELHVPGMTNYLQAWGDDRLIAIGSDGGWSGLILNLFDVSDLAHPKLIEQETIPDAYGSEAQFEHLAFSFFEDQQVLAFPVYTSTGSKMAVYTIHRDTGFTSLGEVNHDNLITSTDYSPLMRRSLEIGGLFYTVSEAGLKVNAFSALTTDLFGEMFPGFSPILYCGCTGDVCMACPQPL